MFNLTSLYNHNSMIKSANEGNEIINNTDFNSYKQARLQAIKFLKVGQKVIYNGIQLIITNIEADTLICSSLTKTGRIKKNTSKFINPLHIELI